MERGGGALPETIYTIDARFFKRVRPTEGAGLSLGLCDDLFVRRGHRRTLNSGEAIWRPRAASGWRRGCCLHVTKTDLE